MSEPIVEQEESQQTQDPQQEEEQGAQEEAQEEQREESSEDELLDMTIEEFLKGATAYEIAETALKRVLVKRRVKTGAMVSVLDEKTLDLCTADIYMWCASTPSRKNDTEDADGSWKHKEGGWQTSAYDKRQLREMAKYLYDKWGEDGARATRIKIFNL